MICFVDSGSKQHESVLWHLTSIEFVFFGFTMKLLIIFTDFTFSVFGKNKKGENLENLSKTIKNFIFMNIYVTVVVFNMYSL